MIFNLPLGALSKSARFASAYSVAVLVACAFFMHGSLVPAALINFSALNADGHPVSGSADFTLNAAADILTIKLTNTTATTFDASDLFTGLDFSLGGLTATMISDTAIRRTVAADGTFTDTATPVDVSWSLVSLGGGNYQLNFNPDAKDAIIGPPTAGSYALANGSIKNNRGHNPFAAEMLVIELGVAGLEDDTPVRLASIRYGGDLAAVSPEPHSGVLCVIGIATMAWGRRR